MEERAATNEVVPNTVRDPLFLWALSSRLNFIKIWLTLALINTEARMATAQSTLHSTNFTRMICPSLVQSWNTYNGMCLTPSGTDQATVAERQTNKKKTFTLTLSAFCSNLLDSWSDAIDLLQVFWSSKHVLEWSNATRISATLLLASSYKGYVISCQYGWRESCLCIYILNIYKWTQCFCLLCMDSADACFIYGVITAMSPHILYLEGICQAKLN